MTLTKKENASFWTNLLVVMVMVIVQERFPRMWTCHWIYWTQHLLCFCPKVMPCNLLTCWH